MTTLFRNKTYTASFPLVISGIALSIWLLLRLVLSLQVGFSQMALSEVLGVFFTGLWFDIAALAYLIVPWLLVSALMPNAMSDKVWMRKARWIMAFFVTFGLLFGAVSEFIFWQEFTTRFNFIAVDYLIYTNEVIGNIRESYPVPLILLGIALIVIAALFALSRFVRFETAQQTGKKKLSLAALAFAMPVMSYQFANVDQMEFSKNAYANELSGNGIFSFSAAARRNELDYDKFYKTMPQAQALSLLKAVGVDRKTTSAVIATPSDDSAQGAQALGPFTRRPKNVVLISVESLSASYLGAYGNQENLTPYLDKLGRESLVFDKLFATGTRTVRGLDALSIAIPPIPGQAIVHRPNSEHLATIGELLEAKNYSTFFIYGGYGVFDSMNTYFRGNDYKVVDRTDFDKSTIQSENVWGVDDESLFNNSLKIFDENVNTNKPFFAHIMTTSNHRPYTFPVGKIDLPQGSRRGAVKYTDYAIGQFIKHAKTKPWFKDTLFVIVADHCASVAGKTKLPVGKYHIPLFFYAPDLLPAGHYSRIASQIDIVPTLLDVLGASGAEHFYGQSMFEAAAKKLPERAFISNYQALGYYKNDTLVVLSPKQAVESYHVDAQTLEASSGVANASLVDEAVAYYQTAARAYKHGDLKEFVGVE
ncbi:MAG: sulfatase-like hydrolase/transferase [Methylotenera sp.]|nr:sulfatase-like hydrolase/transferase [Methylotenera sp.]MDP1754240.1 sulfatase-like hydrolase/transferase [Methylotenera sp.]MDP1958826.1 sulfatase-like hydrolase/transferase [Methylotenera sp.]MDP3303531.1 sulfatase-like hydrolase/transferase [Methylotenera sp.]MDP3943451.1 sulfatase-like hydrolase/transferase [Methylotenera sp.]